MATTSERLIPLRLNIYLEGASTVVIKAIIYPFIAAQVAVELTVQEGRNQLKQALQGVLLDTLSDAREINELKAEIAVLRSEIQQLRYERAQGNGKTQSAAR